MRRCGPISRACSISPAAPRDLQAVEVVNFVRDIYANPGALSLSAGAREPAATPRLPCPRRYLPLAAGGRRTAQQLHVLLRLRSRSGARLSDLLDQAGLPPAGCPGRRQRRPAPRLRRRFLRPRHDQLRRPARSRHRRRALRLGARGGHGSSPPADLRHRAPLHRRRADLGRGCLYRPRRRQHQGVAHRRPEHHAPRRPRRARPRHHDPRSDSGGEQLHPAR